ncbi:DUF6933 domain-containing protein [Enterocloster lavalensis]|uniref:DUF6933 domain-containing protein n=1 Tax=Enterocloster lavalensis TaxID=460384 RepID=UPI001D08B41A|nr:hypothetical protein [Enterocloster lavalensis]MCB6343220.1 hypothetical protein [Enterocloster lavalensis]
MQLGITIPLQKFLKWKPPVYGEPENLFFCWDLHVIRFHGENTLMAVNASNAFTVILWKMEWADWENLEQRTLEAIRKGLLAAGYGEETAEAYFQAAGSASFTKTHGRRPVAALNRMTDFLRQAPMKLEEDRQFQSALCHFVNGNQLKTAGFDLPGRPEVFLNEDMEKSGIKSDLCAQKPSPGAEKCPCRRKCPRRGNCEECLAFHRDQKPGIPAACRKKKR